MYVCTVCSCQILLYVYDVCMHLCMYCTVLYVKPNRSHRTSSIIKIGRIFSATRYFESQVLRLGHV